MNPLLLKKGRKVKKVVKVGYASVSSSLFDETKILTET